MFDWIALGFGSAEATRLPAEFVVKSFCVTAAALALHYLLHVRFPVLCASVWNAVLAVLLLLPLTLLIPPVVIPIRISTTQDPPAVHARPDQASSEMVNTPTRMQALRSSAGVQPSLGVDSGEHDGFKNVSSHHFQISISFVLWLASGIYVAGLCVAGSRLWQSLRTVWRLVDQSEPLIDQHWLARLVICQARVAAPKLSSRVQDVRIVQSKQTRIPFTAGYWRSTIVIPEPLVSAATRTDIDVILLHEMTHIVRRDCSWQLVLKCVQAVHWFNPLVWLAGHSIREARELICDRYCLQMLGDRQQYTDCLLRVAGFLIRTVPLPVGVPMVQTPRIAQRLNAISSNQGLRYCVTSACVRYALLLAALAIGVAWGAGIVTIAVAQPSRAADEHPLPHGAIARLGNHTWRHGATVGQIHCSPDGRRVVTTDANGTFRVWEAETGRLLHAFDLTGAQIRALSFVADEQSVAIVTRFDGQKHLWRFESEPLPALPRAPEGAVNGPFFAADVNAISHYAISVDGQLLASGTGGFEDRPQTVGVSKLAGDKPLDKPRSFDASCPVPGTIEWLAFSPDDRRLVILTTTGGIANGVQVQDPEQTRAVTVFDLTLAAVTAKFAVSRQSHNNNQALAISPDGNKLAVGTTTGPIQIFDLNSGQEINRLEATTSNCLAFSPDGMKLASGGRDQLIDLWDVSDKSTKKKLFSLKGHQSWVETIAFSPNGETLFSGGQDNLVRRWDVRTGEELTTQDGHQYWILGVAITRDGQTAVTSAADGTIRVWDTASGGERMVLNSPNNGWVYSVVFSPDEREIIAGETGRIAAYELATGKETWHYKHSDENAYFKAVHFDRQNHFACFGSDNVVYVWDYEKRDEPPYQIVPERKQADIDACCLSPDGDELALSTSTRMAASSEIEIWHVAGNRLLTKLKPELGGVDHLEFSPDGELLLSSGHSTTHGYIDNRSIASPNLEDSVLLWSLASGKIIRKFGLPPERVATIRTARTSAFSPDGQLLITGERDGSIMIYNVQSGETVAQLLGHSGTVMSIACAANGKQLVSASTDLTGLVWDLKSLVGD